MAQNLSLLQTLRAELPAYRHQSLLIATSGGPDSVALTCGLAELQQEFQLTLAMAHFNHRYRGAESDADADWVALFAEQRNLPCFQGCSSRTPEQFTEQSARDERYAFLAATATSWQASAVVTGHTRNDQVETILHHLFRGTSLHGLRGIPAERTSGALRLWRPLLNVDRAEVLAYLSQRQQDFRTDATNQDSAWTRNWLRRELLPLVESRFPKASEALVRLSQQAANVEELLGWLSRQLRERAVTSSKPGFIELDAQALAEVPAAGVQELLVSLWIEQGWPRRDMTAAHWRTVSALIGKTSGAVSCPSFVEARRLRGRLILQSLPARNSDEATSPSSIPAAEAHTPTNPEAD